MRQRCILLLLAGALQAFWAAAPAADIWVDANAVDPGQGTLQHPFRTVQQAARQAQPGDVVHVRPGVYRERVMPERGGEPGKPIVFQSEVLHGAILKGSDVWAPEWQVESNGLFSAVLDTRLFTDTGYLDGGNPYRIRYAASSGPGSRPPHPFAAVNWTLGQLFAEGQPWRECSSRAELAGTPQAWWFDAAANRIVVNPGSGSPAGRQFELTTRRGVFRPLKKGLGYIELRGFVFEHCANQFPANFWATMENDESGMVGTRSGHHWLIVSNVFRSAKSIGLTFGGGGGTGRGQAFDNELPAQVDPPPNGIGLHRIEGNEFVANGAVGAMGYQHVGVVFTGNVFRRNNALRNIDYESGGIKTHLAYELRVEDNWFIDNDCMGLWIDNTWRKVRIARNIFLGNRGQDIFFEMDDNTPATASLVDHNLFLPGRPELLPAPKDPDAPGPKWSPWSVGIYGHDADGVRIFRNFFAGEGYGLYFRKMTDRKGGASYISASGNVFANSNLTAVCLPAENPPLVRSNWFEANVYPTAARPFVAHAWSVKTGETDAGVIARLSRAVGPDATAQPFGNPAKPPYGYFLSLKQWQTVMNFDQHSRMVAVPWTFDRQTWELTVTLPDELSGIPVPSEREAGEDFFGRPTSAGALAGPFENLTPGKHILKLPRPVGERAVP